MAEKTAGKIQVHAPRTEPGVAFPGTKVCVEFCLPDILDLPALSEAFSNPGGSYPSAADHGNRVRVR